MSEMINQETIETWLDQVGIEHEPAELEDPEFQWGVIAQSDPFQILVAQRATAFPSIYMQLGLTVSEEHRDVLRDFGSEMRDRFLFDLRINLLLKPVGHNVVVEPAEPDIPMVILFAYNLFEENITRASFLRRHHQLQQAALLGAQMFQKMERFKVWP